MPSDFNTTYFLKINNKYEYKLNIGSIISSLSDYLNSRNSLNKDYDNIWYRGVQKIRKLF